MKTAADSVAPVVKTTAEAAAPVVEAAAETVAPVVKTAARTVTPIVETAAQTVAPVVGTVAQTVAPVVETAANVVAPVVVTVVEAVAPVVETTVTVVDGVAAPVVAVGAVAPTVGATLSGAQAPVVQRVESIERGRQQLAGSAVRQAEPAAAPAAGRSTPDPLEPTPSAVATAVPVETGAGFTRISVANALPRAPLAASAPVTRSPSAAAPLVTTAQPWAWDAGSTGTTARTGSRADAPTIPGRSRPFDLVFLGALLAVGAAVISTSSAAGGGGHSPSSTQRRRRGRTGSLRPRSAGACVRSRSA